MYNEITQEEYYNFIKTADKVGNEYCSFSSCCGPHSFSTEIQKDGMLYELSWGWYVENKKTKYWYNMECLHKLSNQEGDGI
jgi:hypothetical protein